ncbi:hypothetical protein CRX72_22350 [Pantoea sp. BRM17]|nr:hypothetical protein CRX72_22350 [Pantoea sp. BRM17]
MAQSNARVTIRQDGNIIYQAYVPPGPFAITDLYPVSLTVQNNYLNLRSGVNLGAWRLRNYSSWSDNGRSRQWNSINTYLQHDVKSLNAQFVAGDSYSPAGVFAIDRVLPDGQLSYDFAQRRLDISIPQAFMQQSVQGAVSPEEWDDGLPAAFVNYAYSGASSRSDARQGGGQIPGRYRTEIYLNSRYMAERILNFTLGERGLIPEITKEDLLSWGVRSQATPAFSAMSKGSLRQRNLIKA